MCDRVGALCVSLCVTRVRGGRICGMCSLLCVALLLRAGGAGWYDSLKEPGTVSSRGLKGALLGRCAYYQFLIAMLVVPHVLFISQSFFIQLHPPSI